MLSSGFELNFPVAAPLNYAGKVSFGNAAAQMNPCLRFGCQRTAALPVRLGGGLLLNSNSRENYSPIRIESVICSLRTGCTTDGSI
jgi:hypothetical protein